MTKKQRHLIYELVAIGFAGIFGVFTIPALLSARDSIAVVCAGLLLIGWAIWLGYFIYRANRSQ